MRPMQPLVLTATRKQVTADTVLRRHHSPRVEHVVLDGEAVVYDCERNAVHLLDPIGTLLWQLLDGHATIRQTSEELAEAFGRPNDEVLADLLGFAAHLEELDLAERAE